MTPTVLKTWGIKELQQYLPTSDSSNLVVDFETTGLDPWHDTIIGVGIASDEIPQGVYFALDGASKGNIKDLMSRISKRNKIAHNVQYEITMYEMWWRRNDVMYTPFSKGNWKYCTQGLLNQIEGDMAAEYTDGFSNRGLKVLQTILLGWDLKGDEELSKWLVDNGYVRKSPKGILPDKSKMCLAPVDILGHYGALDAQSTLLLFNEIYKPALNMFPELDVYHTRDYINLAYLTVEQRLRGMLVDRRGLEHYISNIKWILELLEYEFIYDSEATYFINAFNEMKREEVIGKMPNQYTKTGKVAASYTNWLRRIEENKDKNFFKITSKTKDLPWLLYDCLFKTERREETNWKGEPKYFLDIHAPSGKISVECNNEKHRPVDLAVLPKLGNVGTLLFEYSKLSKELGYCESMLDSLTKDDIHHTRLRLSGTKTDRCSGTGGVNIQQVPKTYDYMKCITHRKGMKLLQMDVNALEPVVLAELSEDPSYMKLYGPNAKANDVYLFVGSGLGEMARPILEDGYDPDNPTKEAIDFVKKKHKKLRGIFKLVHLGASYGASPNRIYQGLTFNGIEITLEECEEIHKNYWKLFDGVVKFVEILKEERIVNKGYVLDGLGCPISVFDKYIKDLLNRVIQNSGHKILVRYLYHLTCLRKANPHLEMYPVSVDFHDETIWEAREDQIEEVEKLFITAWDLTNKELGGIIKLKGDPEICTSWADFKVETPRGIL